MECVVQSNQDFWLPATDYPRASRSFPRIAGSGNEIGAKVAGVSQSLSKPPQRIAGSGFEIVAEDVCML
jgi:hypothetical protein